MVGDRQDGASTAAPSYKKLGKITSTKVGSIYPTLTGAYRIVQRCDCYVVVRPHRDGVTDTTQKRLPNT